LPVVEVGMARMRTGMPPICSVPLLAYLAT
jgi:hypothetical protein